MKHEFRWLEKLDLLDEPLPRQPLVELCGEERVLIENHGGVTQYDSEHISVRVRFGMIVVHGTKLKLCRMCRQQLVISGKIQGITVERGA